MVILYFRKRTLVAIIDWLFWTILKLKHRGKRLLQEYTLEMMKTSPMIVNVRDAQNVKQM